MAIKGVAIALTVSISLGVLVGPLAAQDSITSYHSDGKTPRLQLLSPQDLQLQALPPDSNVGQKVPDKERAALSFLTQNATTYGLPSDLSNLTAVHESEKTLLGSNFRFRQLLGGYEVDGGEIVVSVNDQNKVYQIFNNLTPIPANKAIRATTPQVSQDKAFDIAWTALGAQRDPENGLHGNPQADLKYVLSDQTLKLAYVIRLYVTRKRANLPPRAGLWQVTVDAADGSIIGEPVDETIREAQKRAGDSVYLSSDPDNRQQAFETYYSTHPATASKQPPQRVEGSGLVFDTDPVTTLEDATLDNGSSAARFDKAYSQIILHEVTKRGGKVYLEGPWVTIADFEPPKTPPSSSQDGKWTAKRGQSAFYDVMTYYHLDKSQRYIQSLGYKGDRAIQGLSVRADSDGVNGEDNSHFIFQSNSIAFGHGCVPDNEDAEVILHEYGHAITFSINPKWGGGDSGAIGEGFGDYWASSYRSTTKNGASFQIQRMFNWDASSGCWPGRRLNITQPQYDPTARYDAHQDIGGAQSDELWSTPLFQSFLQLTQNGVPREDVDKIVLESMFGLSSGFTMRDLANKVVVTAKLLFPNGSHAAVFRANFERLNIIGGSGQPSPSNAPADSETSKH